jgi:hypothetical protein
MKGTAIYSQKDVLAYGKRLTVFQKASRGLSVSPDFQINGERLYRVSKMRVDQSRYETISKKTYHIGQVFKEIKHVYDENGILIARRIAPGQPLRTTNKGMCKRLRILAKAN